MLRLPLWRLTVACLCVWTLLGSAGLAAAQGEQSVDDLRALFRQTLSAQDIVAPWSPA